MPILVIKIIGSVVLGYIAVHTVLHPIHDIYLMIDDSINGVSVK